MDKRENTIIVEEIVVNLSPSGKKEDKKEKMLANYLYAVLMLGNKSQFNFK